jgi:NADH-quinone oxidoreductase subunit N
MTICLFSLAGIPPFAGFFSKFFIFMAAFDAGFEWVVFVALVNTVVSLYYYLMIVKAMYINKSEQPIATFTSPGSVQFVVIFCIMATMAFGVVSLPYNFMSYFGFGL